MKRTDIIKAIEAVFISIAGLVTGYALMSLPFHLAASLTPMQMRLVLAGEILIYFTIGSAFFLIKEAKDKKKKQIKQQRSKKATIKIAQQNNDFAA